MIVRTVDELEAERIAAWLTADLPDDHRIADTLELAADAIRRGDHRANLPATVLTPALTVTAEQVEAVANALDAVFRELGYEARDPESPTATQDDVNQRLAHAALAAMGIEVET